MKEIGKKLNASSLKNTSEKDRKKAEGQRGDKKGIIEAPMTNFADAMSAENGTAVSI